MISRSSWTDPSVAPGFAAISARFFRTMTFFFRLKLNDAVPAATSPGFPDPLPDQLPRRKLSGAHGSLAWAAAGKEFTVNETNPTAKYKHRRKPLRISRTSDDFYFTYFVQTCGDKPFSSISNRWILPPRMTYRLSPFMGVGRTTDVQVQSVMICVPSVSTRSNRSRKSGGRDSETIAEYRSRIESMPTNVCGWPENGS